MLVRLRTEGTPLTCGPPILVVIAVFPMAALLGTACHYVDPQCLFLGSGGDTSRQHGSLSLLLQFQQRAAWLHLDDGGGVEYMDVTGDVTVCSRMGEGRHGALADLWRRPILEQSGPLCGPGYAYVSFGDEVLDTCRSAWAGVARRLVGPLSYMQLTYVLEGSAVQLRWDLESQLPKELDEAVTGMLGLLCEASGKLARSLRRSHPELATRVGCQSVAA